MNGSAAFDVGPTLPTIPTARLRLRWLTDADVPALFSVFGDAEVMRYWSHPPFADLAAAATYLEKIRDCFARRVLFQWGLEPASGSGVIGTCTLGSLDGDHRRAELGFALARSHWGRGYMSEILPELLRFAFGRLHLYRITADADPRNAASIRRLEGLGFRREGMLREHYLVNGEAQDGILFGLLKSESEFG